MPFKIIRNDIITMTVDAIVNTANPCPIIGGGVDYAIHHAAGHELLKARQEIGSISVGEAFITDAYKLPAKHVIHTVGPVWQGDPIMSGIRSESAISRLCSWLLIITVNLLPFR